MKILYAIQGTGNGHMARAECLIPELMKYGETDILVSGTQYEVSFPYKIRYRFHGLSFVFGKKGGINYWATLKTLKPFRLLKNMAQLPVHEYDVIISDFEPVSTWACLLKGKRCHGLSHQNVVLFDEHPVPKGHFLGKTILKYYAPATEKFGFHFQSSDHRVFSPIIRDAIRKSQAENQKHYTVYLPSYGEVTIEKMLEIFPDIQWEVFSKKRTEHSRKGNIGFYPVSSEKFTQSLLTCEGVITNAGFETPSEALFLGKKLCVVPMNNQIEQLCNAAMLEMMGIKVIREFDKDRNALREWIFSNNIVHIAYPDNKAEIIQSLFAHIQQEQGVHNKKSLFYFARSY